MRAVINELFYVISLTAISAVVSKFIWLLPFVVFIPIVLTYTVDSPLIYLVFFGIIAEIFAFTPPGLMLTVVFLPWIIFRVFGNLQADMSFLFGFVVVLTVVFQLGILYLPDVYMAKSLMVVPWSKVVPIVLFSSAVGLLSSVAIYFNRSV